MLDRVGRASNIFLRAPIITALSTIGTESAAEAICFYLDQLFEREHALKQLNGMGSVAEKAVAKSLASNNNQVRLDCCTLLKTIGTSESIPALEEARKAGGTLQLAADAAIEAIRSREK